MPLFYNVFLLYSSFSALIYCVTGLHCYQCSGMTNFDPDNCFHPRGEYAIFQECDAGDVCEKTIHHIDRWQSVVSRGCSSNCNGRTYIYTDDFQTHCCDDSSKCNSAPHSYRPHSTVLGITAALTVRLICSYTRI